MHQGKFFAVAASAFAIGSGWFVSPAPAATLYDSAGFEPPKFDLGDLEAQDPTEGPWLQDTGTSTAVVTQSTIANGGAGSQLVRVDRDGSDTRWAVFKPIVPSEQFIIIEWDMRVEQTVVNGVTFGPFFGIEAYDAVGLSFPLIGSLGVDASTGDVLVQDGGGGGYIETTADVLFSEWNHYSLQLDYVNNSYQAFVNHALVASEGFVDGPIAGFSDADITTTIAEAGTELTAVGAAYFDGFNIRTSTVPVPEPAAMGLLGLLVVGLGRRSRRME